MNLLTLTNLEWGKIPDCCRIFILEKKKRNFIVNLFYKNAILKDCYNHDNFWYYFSRSNANFENEKIKIKIYIHYKNIFSSLLEHIK